MLLPGPMLRLLLRLSAAKYNTSASSGARSRSEPENHHPGHWKQQCKYHGGQREYSRGRACTRRSAAGRRSGHKCASNLFGAPRELNRQKPVKQPLNAFHAGKIAPGVK